MVDEADKWPNFKLMECSACGEHFEVPRKWVTTQTWGDQIFIDWEAASALMRYHHQTHNDELVQGIEAYLAGR